MSLVDALMGGVVFGLASTASLQIYGSSLNAAQGGETRQQRMGEMDLALAEGHQVVAGLADRSSSCAAAAVALGKELKMTLSASAAGIRSETKVEGDAVRLTVQAKGLPERSRWYVPAAHGVCVVQP